MQLGFVIDQTRCIGCHACTVACKAENHVPVGSFRTWVKYTEEGTFPEVRRSFTVLRCNQCTDAPCITICPVRALEKRPDGIVDVDPKACIGCKACMQGCPYDALYLNETKGTVEKCHFCAHRTEMGLAPACAVVCPTEAIVPGDFDDPTSKVSRMRREHELQARKVEAGTGPNVLYRGVTPAGIDPLQTNSAGGYLWADRHPKVRVDVQEFEALEAKARARTTYDVAHPPLWGGMITGYLFAKSVAAGVFLAGLIGPFSPLASVPADRAASIESAAVGVPLLGLVFLTVTSLLLVLDLKRPERFFYILTRPNWSSWLVRGTWALIAYGTFLSMWLLLGVAGATEHAGRSTLIVATTVAAALSAGYTGFLFTQAKGRVLWMRRTLWLHLIVQAFVAGSALLILCAPVLELSEPAVAVQRITLMAGLVLHLGWALFEHRLAPRGREKEYERATALVTRGPFAARHWVVGLGMGVAGPLVLLVLGGVFGGEVFLGPMAAMLALAGLYVEEDILVRAGQALPIS